MIRILLVDDQKMVREALKISLEPEIDLEIVGTANDGLSAIEKVEMLQPDIVVMNMEMPNLDGATATNKITNKFYDTKVLILTSYDTDEYVTKSLAMGAKGYLLKSTNTQDIAGAIRNIYKGYTQISPGLLEKLLVYTDSGIVLSKFSNIIPSYEDISLSSINQVTPQPQKAIYNLQEACDRNQAEIEKIRHSLDDNLQEIPQIKKTLSRQVRCVWLVLILWLVSMPLIGKTLLTLNDKTNELNDKTNELQANTIPIERIGVDGKFDVNGIAQRVARAFEQDSYLADVSTIYVAQEHDAIILTGTIADVSLLKRMENIAKQISGVNKVYSGQVLVEKELSQK